MFHCRARDTSKPLVDSCNVHLKQELSDFSFPSFLLFFLHFCENGISTRDK